MGFRDPEHQVHKDDVECHHKPAVRRHEALISAASSARTKGPATRMRRCWLYSHRLRLCHLSLDSAGPWRLLATDAHAEPGHSIDKDSSPPVWQDETSAVRNLQILAGNGLTVDSQPQEWLGMYQDASVLTWGRRTAMRRQLFCRNGSLFTTINYDCDAQQLSFTSSRHHRTRARREAVSCPMPAGASKTWHTDPCRKGCNQWQCTANLSQI